MGRPSKKDIKDFNQYLVEFDFYFMTSLTKQKSMLKLQMFSPTKSPDESIKYTFGILEKAWASAFNLNDFNRKVVRFKKISFLPTLSGELAKNNMGTIDTEKVTNLSIILKKHLIG